MSLLPKTVSRAKAVPTTACRYYATSISQKMDAQVPPWLRSIFNDPSPPKRLYAWSFENVHPCSHRKHSSPGDLERRIFILGLGNIGRLYASFLARLPHHPPITLVVHRKTLLADWARGDGIELTREGLIDKNKDFDVEWWAEERPDKGPVREVAGGSSIQNLLITTKAGSALPEADRLRHYLDGTSTVAFAQNGMAKLWPPHGQTYIAHRYPSGKAPNFISCVTTHGVTSLGPYRSVHASPADAVIGPVLPNPTTHERASYLVDCITEAPHLQARQVSRADLWILQLEKLIVNSIINPLTAVLRCKNGVLFQEHDGPLVHVMDTLLKEASSVLQALVKHESSSNILIELSERNEVGLATQQEMLTERFSFPRLRSMLHRVGSLVAANTSSMLQDIQADKELEIRDFNGWIVDMATYLDCGLNIQSHKALIGAVEQRVTVNPEQLRDLLLCQSQTLNLA